MDVTDDQIIRQLFDDYLRMYCTRDDRLTTYFSENFSGFTGGGDFLVKDRERWVAITRQDFAQIKDPIRIELKDLAIQSLADTVAVATGFFVIHLPIKDHILSNETARLVLIFRKESEGWKISHSSISVPYHLVREGEIYPLQELTARNRFLEELIDERTTQLSEAQSIASLGNWTVDFKTGRVEMSDETCHMKGLEPSSQNALLFLELECRYSPESWDRLTAAVAETKRTGVPYELELETVRPDGSKGWVLTRGEPERDAMGAVVGLHGISMDITKRRQAEEALRRSEKLASLGQLAGGVAHDFNNILMVIQSYAQLLQDKLPAQDTLRRNTEAIVKAVDRAAFLTRQMLAFSRKQVLSPVVLDLNAVIHEAAKMLRRLIGEDIEFRVSSAASLWAVEADMDQIVQVLMNLSVNARDAMAQGGTLTIATGNITVAEEDVSRRQFVVPGDYVRVSVADTGTGISRELQEHIFEPFFTTKEVGKGAGLGLATVYGIVKQSGGYVWVESEPQHGSCFTIYLPRVKQAVAHAVAKEAEEVIRGSETILVAEDEASLREGMCEYLGSLGYTVLAADSGKEAMSMVVEHEGHIDLLLTDLIMPAMSGKELSEKLCSLRPDMKTIYMSGYAGDKLSRHGIQETGAMFLQKPFSLGTLARKVRDTLEKGSRA
jgi:signal transduction histidine kinase/ActR/RegA family two-component response regulator/ketosteroid isomerase-like protein